MASANNHYGNDEGYIEHVCKELELEPKHDNINQPHYLHVSTTTPHVSEGNDGYLELVQHAKCDSNDYNYIEPSHLNQKYDGYVKAGPCTVSNGNSTTTYLELIDPKITIQHRESIQTSGKEPTLQTDVQEDALVLTKPICISTTISSRCMGIILLISLVIGVIVGMTAYYVTQSGESFFNYITF